MMKPVQPTGLVEGKAYLPLGKWFIIKAGCMIYRCRFRFASDDTTYSQFLLNFEDEDELQMEMRVGLAALVNSNFHLTRMLTSNLEMIVVIRKPCPKVAAKAFRWQKPDHHGSLVSVQFVLQISHRTTT
ncbi:hypothetical protein, variant [Sphaeroforma arctica JP610]|nr:hypothetical protein, variant [Sphaeroforma arctica JP610]KNC82864.1 hypothetical protein, variant [Sphaeroforma arctica JP610]|eukprot:XP_014156766.1 hypothetical protein, variant [Sphaeroforma arctica JP610]